VTVRNTSEASSFQVVLARNGTWKGIRHAELALRFGT
jgi:hypothetical protein